MEEINPKDAFSKFKPECIAFVLSVDKKGNPSGLIAARLMKVSRTPPLIAVSLGKKSKTHELIKESKEFVIALANKDLLQYIAVFGRKSGHDVDKFKETGIKTASANHIKTPLLIEATINFECRLVNEVDAGNSTLFLGKILATYINESKKILFNFGKGYGDYKFEEP
ncbi:flavin reductase family protein [Candidatus Woesearchaeota archaeon]|nr:flavin reductase family protein [Candidatus Woesearchaeota archaeon]